MITTLITVCLWLQAHIFTWKGHTKGVAAVRWFPGTAHLMLSAGMDCRVKVLLLARA